MSSVITRFFERLSNYTGRSTLMDQYLQSGQHPSPQRPDHPPPYRSSPDATLQAAELCSTNQEARTKNVKIGFELIPDIHAPHPKLLDWLAILEVTTRDISFLMREGFSWSEDNVQKQKGRFQFGNHVKPDAAKYYGWTCARTYFLADVEEDPMWTAKLTVYAREPRILSRFRLSDLRVEQVMFTIATDHNGSAIYGYYALEPENAFNALFDDMPMTGWWPWPRSRLRLFRDQQMVESTGITPESPRILSVPYQPQDGGHS